MKIYNGEVFFPTPFIFEYVLGTRFDICAALANRQYKLLLNLHENATKLVKPMTT